MYRYSVTKRVEAKNADFDFPKDILHFIDFTLSQAWKNKTSKVVVTVL